MRTYLAIVAAIFSAVYCSTTQAQMLSEQEEIPVSCVYTAAESFVEVGIDEGVAQAGEYSYRAWLPPGYQTANALFPCVFVMSPAGHAESGNLLAAARRYNLILILLDQARNGPHEPILGNFLAAHDDAIHRFRIDPERKYATGVSGGARGASAFIQVRPGFKGVLLQAAGFATDSQDRYVLNGLKPGMRVCLVTGTRDPNLKEAELLRNRLPSFIPFQHLTFEGGHQAAPPEMVEQAFGWLLESP